LPSFDKETVAGNFLGLFLGFSGKSRHLVARYIMAWLDPDRTQGQAHQRIEDLLSLPVLAVIAAKISIFRSKVGGHGLIECKQNGLTTRFPVIALEEDNEIVSADVPDKIQVRIAMLNQNTAQKLNGIVSFAIAVDIVERLEMVQVGIARAKTDPVMQQAVDVLVDRHVPAGWYPCPPPADAGP